MRIFEKAFTEAPVVKDHRVVRTNRYHVRCLPLRWPSFAWETDPDDAHCTQSCTHPWTH